LSGIDTEKPVQVSGQFQDIIAVPGASIHLEENSEVVVSRRINVDSVKGDRGSCLIARKGRVGNLDFETGNLRLIGAGKILGKILNGKLGTVFGGKLR
jgi:hypothetical protein